MVSESAATVEDAGSGRRSVTPVIPRKVLILVLALFSCLTAVALWRHGYWGIVEPHFQSFGAAQVLADLVIALTLALVWMRADAKRTNRAFWPWLALTLAAGSFGPLLYLLAGKPSRD
jgi:hypothetical protein